ncbi:MAG TPA: type II toxin-antitoxin system ParD family antitoxin [Rhodocyclaceae bacterium]|nr:type II toxin-antitoxin system ParD family antitoxin [Rhodocyclaceae bacterium]
MSRNTLNLALPESLRAYIDIRVASGHYGNTSEYIRDLIRKDQAEEAKKRLRALVEDGLMSGSGSPWTEADRDELIAIANGEIE